MNPEEEKYKFIASTGAFNDIDDDEEEDDDDEKEDSEEEQEFEEYTVSFACEDCDYRWEATFESEEEADEIQICPMCGTANTTQI